MERYGWCTVSWLFWADFGGLGKLHDMTQHQPETCVSFLCLVISCCEVMLTADCRLCYDTTTFVGRMIYDCTHLFHVLLHCYCPLSFVIVTSSNVGVPSTMIEVESANVK